MSERNRIFFRKEIQLHSEENQFSFGYKLRYIRKNFSVINIKCFSNSFRNLFVLKIKKLLTLPSKNEDK